MPARVREIGPEVSLKVAAAVLSERTRREWSRPRLSAEMAQLGYRMSAATVRSIEKGITEHGETRVRIVSVDEAKALGKALWISGLLARIDFGDD